LCRCSGNAAHRPLEHPPHLPKPFKIDDLLEAVATLFKTPCAPLAA
jgi:hypothetical protein